MSPADVGRACMLAPRDLADLPGRACGYTIAGAAGASARIHRLADRPDDASPVTLWATLSDPRGRPVDDRGQVFFAFTGVTGAVHQAVAGAWALTMDPNGDPVTVTPPSTRRSMAAVVHVCVRAAAWAARRVAAFLL